MKNLIKLLLISSLSLMGCSGTQKAIDLVKGAKFPGTEMLNQEYAQKQIDDGVKDNIQYKWKAEYKPEFKAFLVSFVDTKYERGYFWESDLNNQIVRSIMDNWMLKKRYGITPVRQDYSFKVESIAKEELINKKGVGIYYKISADIRNTTDKTISEVNGVGAKLIAVYSDTKTIEVDEDNTYTEIETTNENHLWKPDSTRKIEIETNAYDSLYAQYKPIDIYCFIYLYSAKDPLGFDYSGAIEERDLNSMYESIIVK